MEKFVISGGKPLRGEVIVAGAKNVALKALVASLLTNEEIILHNVPNIRDVSLMLELLTHLGVAVSRTDHTVFVRKGNLKVPKVPLEVGARLRTSSMVIGPMLARWGKAQIPNPGGCRIGARPIDRHIEGLRQMGATIDYHSEDGYFYAEAGKLQGTTYTFPKNTHTGTETLILAAVLAEGRTVLENAAEEVEIDDLISLLKLMGAQIQRVEPRTIIIEGVEKLQGAKYTLMPDRNEEVTFAVAAAATGGDILVHQSRRVNLQAFLEAFEAVGGSYETIEDTTTRYFIAKKLRAIDIITAPYPGFMTDWQGPWAVLLTQVHGVSTIHETVFESRFSYVAELGKMGAHIEFFDPPVTNPREFYNFNWEDRDLTTHQAIKIHGPTKLHNAVVEMSDLRAGATLVLAALVASGESYVHGVEHIDRGYENIEGRLRSLGAAIRRVKEEEL